jgi:hypothetical protein
MKEFNLRIDLFFLLFFAFIAFQIMGCITKDNIQRELLFLELGYYDENTGEFVMKDFSSED